MKSAALIIAIVAYGSAIACTSNPKPATGLDRRLRTSESEVPRRARLTVSAPHEEPTCDECHGPKRLTRLSARDIKKWEDKWSQPAQEFVLSGNKGCMTCHEKK